MTAVESIAYPSLLELGQSQAVVMQDGRSIGLNSRWSSGGILLRGSALADDLSAGPLADVILGYGGSDRLAGFAGDDVLCGGDGDDELSGGEGNDQLLGGAGRDLLCGGDGDDDLIGGEGDDVLTGGDGCDAMRGDAGSDTFVWYCSGLPASAMDSDAYDSIEDFSLEEDNIDLRAVVSGASSFSLSLRVDAEGSSWLHLAYSRAGGYSHIVNIVLSSLDVTNDGGLSTARALEQMLDHGVVLI
jgi:Ca2+-binding RTX toxin-like protein